MEPVTRQEFAAMVTRQDKADTERHAMRHDITQIKSDTGEVVEMFRALSGGLQVLQGLGKIARPITYIAGCIAAVYGVVPIIKGWFK